MASKHYLIVMAVLGMFSGCQVPQYSAKADFEKSIAISEQTRLEASTSNGEVKVVSHDGQSVEILAHLVAYGESPERAKELLNTIKPVIETTDESVRIDVPKVNGFLRYAVSYELQVPKGMAVALKTSNGAVEAIGSLRGIDIETSNGKVLLDGGSQKAKIKTSNGSIKVVRFAGEVDAKSSNGTIRLEHCRLEGFSKVETSNGLIAMAIDDDRPIRFSAKTSNGRIQSDLPFLVQGKMDKTNVEGILNSEEDVETSASLNLKTSNGNIEVKPSSETKTEAILVEEHHS